MKKSKITLAAALGLTCAVVSMGSIARVSITEVDNRVIVLEGDMPTKADASKVNQQLATKAGINYVDNKLATLQATAGPQGPTGNTGAKGQKGDTGVAGQAGATGLAGADGNHGGACSAVQGGGSTTIHCDDASTAIVQGSANIEGFNSGDTLYWDGSQWQIVPAPLEEESRSLVLTLVNQVVSWQPVTVTRAQ
jgi:hypothetical protein